LPKAVLARLSFVKRASDALADADALLLVTEWRNYRSLDWEHMKKAMRTAVIFDGRNLYDPRQREAQGVTCIDVGRGNVRPKEKPRALRPAVSCLVPER
jgi:UDPglucose 6-dehydrogenase